MIIEQAYVTERGRKRRRAVRIDLAEVRRGLGLPASGDHADWVRIRTLLRDAVGESTFSIWLEPLELIAIDRARTLIVAAPAATSSWVTTRFGHLLTTRAERVGRLMRFADGPERTALAPNQERLSDDGRAIEIKQQEVS